MRKVCAGSINGYWINIDSNNGLRAQPNRGNRKQPTPTTDIQKRSILQSILAKQGSQGSCSFFNTRFIELTRKRCPILSKLKHKILSSTTPTSKVRKDVCHDRRELGYAR